ncbi:MAG TPA: hypothetical protein VMT93_02210 [Gemmatimonadaceae bacterium]|nr:hypothetical protein [Gemmatimonadaceae bacterium]
MKLLLVMYSGSRPGIVPELLEHQGVHGYTELRGAHGAGASGRREGTRAWPGDTAVFFSMVDDEHVPALLGVLREQGARSQPGERIHVAELPVEYFS